MKDDVVLRKQLIRDLSHELKTPVAVIKGYAEGMCYGLAENEQERNQYCEIISRECDRIDQMVRDMLELSWLEQVAIVPRREKINVYPFAEQQLEKYQRRIEEKACSVELNGAVNDMICADQKLFERVFDNLVSNAVKYVNQQGIIEIRFIEKKQDAFFEVYNSGANIPEDQMDKIWNAFYKLDASRKRENGSHGIGLAIVKAILDLHGGSVFVKNEENGVRFGCIFPKTSP